MQDQLIKLLSERVGIDEATAGKAVDTVMGFLKDNPQEITSLLGDIRGEDGKLDMSDVGQLKDRLGGLFGKR